MFSWIKGELSAAPPKPPRPRIKENLVAVGGDLSPASLLKAYRGGCFPWTVNPITWWSPDPRTIFEFESFHISASLGRTLRRRPFQVTFNQAFREVIAGCAAPRAYCKSTWIAPAFIEGYTRLHEQGRAHSVECWEKGVLAGGIYGVAIGGYFVAESMFHRVPNASKVALCELKAHLEKRGYTLFDIEMPTPITLQFGAVTIPRSEFLRRLAEAVEKPVTFL